MRNLKKIIIFVLVAFCINVNISFSDVNSDLKKRKNELAKLQTNISNKKAEKEKFAKEEKKVKQELAKISKAISKNEKELSSLKTKLETVEKDLNTASDEYSKADSDKRKYLQMLNEDCLDYVKKKSAAFFDYSLQFEIRKFTIEDDTLKYNSALDNGAAAKSNIDKYTKSKKNFISLKNRQQNIMSKNIGIKNNKNKQLKTAADRRAKAEKDIKEMNNSQKSLEALVKKLTLASNKERDKTRSLREKNTKTRKNNLPWPVDGKVVLNYGKNKHPELDTNIVSNGIKIKAANNDTVKAVDDGTVVFVGEFRSYGKMIIVDHKGVFFSVYSQLKSVYVKESQNVVRQQQIAGLGNGNDSVLYFEIRQYNVPEDPLLWLKERK